MGRNRKGNTTLCGRNLQRRRGTAQRDFFRDEVLAIGILVCWGKDMRARSENHLEVDEARLRRAVDTENKKFSNDYQLIGSEGEGVMRENRSRERRSLTSRREEEQ